MMSGKLREAVVTVEDECLGGKVRVGPVNVFRDR